jgi:probable DNA metabolism protein
MRFHVQLEAGADFERWRDLARGLLNARCEPDQVSWNSTEQPELLGGSNAGSLPDVQPNAAVARATSATRVPRQFVEAAQLAYLHAHPERFAFVYRVLWRLTHGESQLLELAVDGDVVRLHAMTRAVQRDMHKMKAFVRFKETPLSIDANLASARNLGSWRGSNPSTTSWVPSRPFSCGAFRPCVFPS